VGDALKDRATVNNIKENRQLPMVKEDKTFYVVMLLVNISNPQ